MHVAPKRIMNVTRHNALANPVGFIRTSNVADEEAAPRSAQKHAGRDHPLAPDENDGLSGGSPRSAGSGLMIFHRPYGFPQFHSDDDRLARDGAILPSAKMQVCWSAQTKPIIPMGGLRTAARRSVRPDLDRVENLSVGHPWSEPV